MGKSLRIVTLSLVFVLALVICGCSGGNAQSASSTSASASTSSAAATTSTSSAASSQATSSAAGVGLANGIYTAEFNTDSSMFHVNEANDGKGELTVSDDGAVIHVSLVSKKIVNLYAGLAEDAQKDGAVLIEPTVDTVTYSDGYTEDVYGFDIPVPALDEEFDVAILGESGKWFDHKVSVSSPVAE